MKTFNRFLLHNASEEGDENDGYVDNLSGVDGVVCVINVSPPGRECLIENFCGTRSEEKWKQKMRFFKKKKKLRKN